MIDWAELRHAYGSAEDVPEHLAALRSQDEDERREAFGELYASITHQGNRYSATAAAVPPLLELIADPKTQDRDLLLHLLGLIAVGDDAAWLPGPVDRARLDPDEAKAYDAVGAGLPVLYALTTDPELADSAAYVIGWYPGRPESVPVLAAVDSPTAVVALGLLGERPPTDERPLMRWAGAVARRDPGELLPWASSDHDIEPTIPYLRGDIAGLALLSLTGEPALDAALARLRHVSAEPALTTIGVALREVFPHGSIPTGTPYGDLTEPQQRVVRALAETPEAWLYDGAEYVNVSLLVSDYGLPHGRARLTAYAARRS
ncbi:hypothetical protein [Paractinoplanes lichenicola]|uniref:HEAT repeat domain-containing protein n=1 Tax=Paractinoplanes lichenicola TaxID=2802976 RepID=A0ABS1VDL8_9ACTN|nr:hypothetical protein [Actinoplanes lichenicola]MBL7252767.1 hypothetical protein [Actinoplanes lichenicola]